MRSFFLEKGFCGLAKGKKKSHVQHFKLSLAGGKLNFIEKPTYPREIWAWNGVICFRVLSPNPLHLWDCYIGKENGICHIYVGLDGPCFKCNRKKDVYYVFCMCIAYTGICVHMFETSIIYIFIYRSIYLQTTVNLGCNRKLLCLGRPSWR